MLVLQIREKCFLCSEMKSFFQVRKKHMFIFLVMRGLNLMRKKKHSGRIQS